MRLFPNARCQRTSKAVIADAVPLRPWPRRLLDGFLKLCGWLLVLLSFLMLLMALPPPIGLSR